MTGQQQHRYFLTEYNEVYQLINVLSGIMKTVYPQRVYNLL